MRKAKVYMHNKFAGILEEHLFNQSYFFRYNDDYMEVPISLKMPTQQRIFSFNRFPPFFEGLLPEGWQLEGLLRNMKIDKQDYFKQLVTVGQDMVGAVTVEEIIENE